ncbi:MAG: PepSY domain-containing protein, partial [Clostridia bacterium]|nr:PepSY domain-containing protein [Clostridia bacterium]
SCEFKAKGREYECDIDALTGEVLSFESEKLPSPKPTSAPTAAPTSKPSQKPTDAPSGQEYIGRSAALTVALKDAGLEKSDVHDIDIERETRNGVVVYEVDFEHDGWEYDYVINARTGKIIEKHREHDGGSGSGSGVSFIGEAAAWRIALERAGLTESQISGREIELDCDNGAYCYELEFRAGKYEYEVKINAVTGAVMRFERELDD